MDPIAKRKDNPGEVSRLHVGEELTVIKEFYNTDPLAYTCSLFEVGDKLRVTKIEPANGLIYFAVTRNWMINEPPQVVVMEDESFYLYLGRMDFTTIRFDDALQESVIDKMDKIISEVMS